MMYILVFLYSAASFFTVYNSCRLAELVMNREKKNGVIFPAVYVALSAVYIFFRLSIKLPLLDFGLLILHYLWLFACVKKAAKIKLFQTLYIVLMYLSVESLLQSLFRYMTSLFYDGYKNGSIEIIILLFGNLLLFFIIDMLEKKTKTLWQFNIIPRYIYVLILLAVFFGGGLIETQLSLTNIQIQGFLSRTFTVISIFLLIFIIISLIFNCISKAYLENVSSMLEDQVKAQVEYYKKADKLNTELRNFRHDYKNHLLCLQGLLDGEEYDEARDYLHSITLRQTASGKDFSSGNTIVNAILADKSETAEHIGAEIRFQGIVYEDIPAVDVCTIFANALDNALEACGKLTGSGPKIISVKCSYVKHIQFINITNPTSEEIKIVNNAIETSKKDKNLHGIGLYNIRRTVEKYDGEFDISCEGGMFTLDVGFKVN